MYCSKLCKERSRVRTNPPKSGECNFCGKHFLYTKHQKYCDATCRRKASNKRNREKPKKGFIPVVKQCRDCETQITVVHPNTKLCDPCKKKKQREYKNAWRESKKPPIEDKVCLNCGRDFTPKNRNNVQNCSLKCTLERINKRTDVRLNNNIRGRLRASLKCKGITKRNHTYSLVDFTRDELKEHLESQFTDGMSWDNMSEWHIDHIRPVSSFNYDSTEHPDFKKCWALNNLQPLWAEDNLRKNDKWDGVVNA